MSDALKNIGRTDRYLRGELDEQERQEFERELQSDTALQQELELHREMMAGVDRYGEKHLKSWLNEVHESAVKIQKKPYKFYLMASILAMVGIVVSVIIIDKPFLKNREHQKPERPEIEVNEQPSTQVLPDWSPDDVVLQEADSVSGGAMPAVREDKQVQAGILQSGISLVEIEVPEELQYWFDGDRLFVWGDYTIAASDIIVKRIREQHYLKYKGRHYRVAANARVSRPVYVRDVREQDLLRHVTKSEQTVVVHLVDVVRPYTANAKRVDITIEAAHPDYSNHYVLRMEETPELTLYGPYEAQELKLVKFANRGTYFLVDSDQVFVLEASGKVMPLLPEDRREIRRMLLTRESAEQPLFVFDFEASAHSIEH